MSNRNQNTGNNNENIKPSSSNEDIRSKEEDTNEDVSHDQSEGKRRTQEETNTSGYGSSQRSRRDHVGPLESDLEQLPSKKRLDRGNLTGPGLG